MYSQLETLDKFFHSYMVSQCDSGLLCHSEGLYVHWTLFSSYAACQRNIFFMFSDGKEQVTQALMSVNSTCSSPNPHFAIRSWSCQPQLSSRIVTPAVYQGLPYFHLKFYCFIMMKGYKNIEEL